MIAARGNAFDPLSPGLRLSLLMKQLEVTMDNFSA